MGAPSTYLPFFSQLIISAFHQYYPTTGKRGDIGKRASNESEFAGPVEI